MRRGGRSNSCEFEVCDELLARAIQLLLRKTGDGPRSRSVGTIAAFF
jgi:hypothetical protein